MARSLVDSLWTGLSAQHDLRQPEQRAEFWQQIRGMVRQIGHNQVRGAFADDIEARIAAMRTASRGDARSFGAMQRPRVRRPAAGAIHRHRAICALIVSHPELVSEQFEQLLSIDSGDPALERLKKAAIDAVIRDPDLDAAALRHHLNGLNFVDELSVLEGEELKARMPFDPVALSSEEAGDQVLELLQLVSGASGLFSSPGISTR
jgi:DNA primase